MIKYPDRRKFIALAAALMVGAIPHAAQANGLRGCCILPRNSDAAFRTAFNRKVIDPDPAAWERNLGSASGVSSGFEKALGELLVDMSIRFGVVPGFGFYDDTHDPNAWAIDGAVVRRTHGMIAFGRSMLQAQLRADPQGISVAAICAHEFAHIYQYQSAYYNEITGNYPPHILELHADFLAGAYMHHLEATRTVSLQAVGRAWEAMGRSRFTRASTHGSSAMRLDSIQAGYFWAQNNDALRMPAMASAGLAHVRRHANR